MHRTSTYPPPPDDAPLIAWAQWYASLGWPVFPVHGKEPLQGSHGFHEATTDLEQITQWWSWWPACNIATPTGLTWWALDVDARHEGMESLQELERTYGALPRTVTSLTGSGGGSCHLLWAVGEHPIRNKANRRQPAFGPGLDVQGPGSYIVLPPSVHPETQQRYCWEADFGPDDLLPQSPPAWLENLVTTEETPGEALGASRTPQDGPIPEGRRESTLMSLAGAMRRQGASYATVLAALSAENERCEPPLAPADLERMAASVQRYDAMPTLRVGTPPVGWSVEGVPEAVLTMGLGQGWRKELFTKPKTGELLPNLFNITQILRFHEHWQRPENFLWLDVIRGLYMCGDTKIDGALLVKIGHWLGGQERMPLTSLSLLEQCLHEHCEQHKRDLIKLWLESLPAWDRLPRLETWLQDIAHVEDSSYARELSRRFIVSMVARGLHPGCQYREVIILEGHENIGKSHIVEAMATREWYTPLSMNLETKEAHMALHKHWLAELPELDSMSRTEESRLKAFVTMEDDIYVPKYKNESASFPRRCILIGTTNDHTYFKSSGSNSRYLPIWLPGPVDLDKLHTIRQQLFAEALTMYGMTPETWWKIPQEIEGVAQEERELRRIATDYEQPLHEWLEYGRFATVIYANNAPVVFTPGETSWPEIATYFLKIETPERWKDKSLQMQIAAALKALGWQSVPVWRYGRMTKIWQKQSEENHRNRVPF